MNKERLVNEFLEMVKINSVTRTEGAFASVLSSKLEQLGFDVYVDGAGEKAGCNTGNIIGKIKGNKDVRPVLFCAHMDTVVPGENIHPVIKDDTIYSDGTTILGADDKAGIAAILEAIRYIKENNIPHGDIEVVFTISEEGGLYGAKNLDYSKIQSELAFVLDSGGEVGGVIIQGPAQNKIFAKITGKAAHAGVAPELGISAIQVAARAIDHMKLLRIDHETTANIGTITGGTSTNIVADSVDMAFELRSLNAEKLKAQMDHMVSCINNACDDYSAKSEINIVYNYPSFTMDRNSEIVKIVESAMEKINIQIAAGPTGGGSDTNIFNGNGLKAVTLAIGMTRVHTTSEYITIKSLVDSARLVAAIIQEIN